MSKITIKIQVEAEAEYDSSNFVYRLAQAIASPTYNYRSVEGDLFTLDGDAVETIIIECDDDDAVLWVANSEYENEIVNDDGKDARIAELEEELESEREAHKAALNELEEKIFELEEQLEQN